jgi:hypothetical protein
LVRGRKNLEPPPAPLGKGEEELEPPPAPLGKGGGRITNPPTPLGKGGGRIRTRLCRGGAPVPAPWGRIIDCHSYWAGGWMDGC